MCSSSLHLKALIPTPSFAFSRNPRTMPPALPLSLRVRPSGCRHGPSVAWRAAGAAAVRSMAVDGEYSSKRGNISEPSETIWLPGCDYNHWHIVMEFPKDPAPTREQMIDTYLNTLATVLGRKDKGLLWRLDDYDWERFSKIRNMLEVFEEATKTFSGTLYPTSNLFLPGVIEIKEHIERGTLDNDNLVRLMCLNMKEKFDKYWSECGLLMAIAIVLDPRYKMSFIKFAFQSIYQSSEYDARVKHVRDSLADLYSYYSVMPVKINSDGTFLSGDVAVGPPKNSLIRNFDDYLESSCATRPLKSELELYLEDDLVKLPQELKNKFEILDWWKMISLKLPTLSKMAKDILTVPITTVASESAFSAGGRVLDDYRSALSPASVNALVCTSNWLSAQFKKPKDPMKNILIEEELTIQIPDSTSGSTSGC